MLTPRILVVPELLVLAAPCLPASALASSAPADGGNEMAQQATAGAAATARQGMREVAAPDVAIRIAGALLALAVAGVHVADQGGVTAMAAPGWIGWGYRIIEVGGVLVALALLVPGRLRVAPDWTAWAAGALLGVGPFVAYIASRTVGVPGDPGDVGNWGYWLGTVSLFVEAALVVLSVSMVLANRSSS
jgi:hypothetical protein